MKRIGVLALLAVALLGLRAASAQSALERLESRLRERAVKPPAQTPPGQAWLGVVADDEKDRGRGVRVVEVSPEGPAAKAGILVQDLITSVGGIRTRQMTELVDMLEMYAPGDSVDFEVLRGDKPQKLQVTLAQPPQPGGRDSPAAPKPQEPLLLAPDVGPATPVAEPVPPAPAPAPLDALRARLEKLEQRVAELERALKDAPKPEK